MYKSLLRPLLFCFPAEFSKTVGLHATRFMKHKQVSLPTRVMGIDFPNPVGLAAGFDKCGDYIDSIAKLGAGFIELGSVTPSFQAGNPKPRVFRLQEDNAIINRLGFNNKGVDYLVEKIKQSKSDLPLGVSIMKDTATPIEKGIDDYAFCLTRVYRYASYCAIDVSCPNTKDIRDLQYGDFFESLIKKMQDVRTSLSKDIGNYLPLAVKVSPNLLEPEIERMSDVMLRYNMDGIIATNTSISRKNLYSPYACEGGGLSGSPIYEEALHVQKRFQHYTQGKIEIIASGGIMTPQDAVKRIQAGAKAIQVYTGLIYNGPELIENIVNSLM